LREGTRQAGMLAFPFAAAREREKHIYYVFLVAVYGVYRDAKGEETDEIIRGLRR